MNHINWIYLLKIRNIGFDVNKIIIIIIRYFLALFVYFLNIFLIIILSYIPKKKYQANNLFKPLFS